MKHTWYSKGFLRNFNIQKNVTSKMDKIFKGGCIVLSGLQRWMVDSLFNFSKFLKDVAEITKIVEGNEANGPK